MDRVFLLLTMCIGISMSFPYDLNPFTSDLEFHPVISDDFNLNEPPDDYSLTSLDPLDETYTGIDMGSQIAVDPSFMDANLISQSGPDQDDTNLNMGNFIHSDDLTGSNNLPSSSTDLARVEPELQPLEYAAVCPEDKSILCCNPKTHFGGIYYECIYCKRLVF